MIRGLTLLHPWAFAVQRLGKDVENRSRDIGAMGGRVGMHLAIHGGVAPRMGDNEKWWQFCDQVEGLRHILEAGKAVTEERVRASGIIEDTELGPRLRRSALIVPGIVAVARVSACVRGHPSPWSARGQWQYELSDVVVLEQPIPHRGAQGLWEIQPDVLAQLEQVCGSLA